MDWGGAKTTELTEVQIPIKLLTAQAILELAGYYI
jgi:hypothetical protein